VDNETALPRDDPNYDKLFKITFTSLSHSFAEHFNIGQNVAVDEHMVKGNSTCLKSQ
jgi:hypothetical protein